MVMHCIGDDVYPAVSVRLTLIVSCLYVLGCGDVDVTRHAALAFDPLVEASFEEVYRYEFATGNPLSFHVLEENVLAVVDYDSPERIVSIMRMPDGETLGSLREGQGPSELSRGGLKYIHPLTRNRLWVWDGGARRGIVLDGMEEQSTIHRPSALLFVPLNDTAAVSYGNSRSQLATYHRIDLEAGSIDDPHFGIEYADHSDMQPLHQNYLLKQGAFAADDDALFIGLHFGSHVYRVAAEGLGFETFEPARIPIPPPASDDGSIMAPDNADHPQTALALSVDGDELYVLFSGVQLQMSEAQAMLLAARGRLDAVLEEAETSDRLLVYDKYTGEFLREVRLPVRARDVEIRGEDVYILTVDDMPPTIIRYRMEQGV